MHPLPLLGLSVTMASPRIPHQVAVAEAVATFGTSQILPGSFGLCTPCDNTNIEPSIDVHVLLGTSSITSQRKS